MEIGLVYPQTEFGDDPAAIQDYAQMAEGLGFSHVLAFDHILGANPDRPGGWKGPYTYQTPFHEPFVLFSYMAGVTKTLGFATGILILPQRQTALVAKQAATLDVLSSGRLRVGVGLGWNEVEYAALGQDFHSRGRRIEEQVTLLRQLWTQPLVNFEGRWDTIPDAGINPLPVQQPIPIWFGGHAEPVLRRTARLGDGWMPNYRTPEDARNALGLLQRFIEEVGRKPGGLGIEARLPYGEGSPEMWRLLARDWQAVGATHLSFNTMGVGLSTPAEHLKAITDIAMAVLPA
ncbi:MAG TPA: LLM class F420-dependent oxidoreductase [Anaerolineales bacterium]|nr:LLM class F420-dependent oxidoreductase [Anaerolineales bacterium]